MEWYLKSEPKLTSFKKISKGSGIPWEGCYPGNALSGSPPPDKFLSPNSIKIEYKDDDDESEIPEPLYQQEDDDENDEDEDDEELLHRSNLKICRFFAFFDFRWDFQILQNFVWIC